MLISGFGNKPARSARRRCDCVSCAARHGSDACMLGSRRLRAMRAARMRAADACKPGVRSGETAAAFHLIGEGDIGSHLRPRLTPAGPEPNFCRAGQEMVNSMTTSIRALLSSAAHSVVRGLAVVALVVVWSVGHIGTYALSVVGVSTAVLTTTATPADAWWRRWGWRGRRWRRYRRWRRW
jgi:hypothetical protein